MTIFANNLARLFVGVERVHENKWHINIERRIDILVR